MSAKIEVDKKEIELMLMIVNNWEKSNLIDYSLMKGADYIQRSLSKMIGVDYKPLNENNHAQTPPKSTS